MCFSGLHSYWMLRLITPVLFSKLILQIFDPIIVQNSDYHNFLTNIIFQTQTNFSQNSRFFLKTQGFFQKLKDFWHKNSTYRCLLARSSANIRCCIHRLQGTPWVMQFLVTGKRIANLIKQCCRYLKFWFGMSSLSFFLY